MLSHISISVRRFRRYKQVYHVIKSRIFIIISDIIDFKYLNNILYFEISFYVNKNREFIIAV